MMEAGKILFEMGGVEETAAKEAMRLASHKLPIDTKFVVRHATGAAVGAEAAAKELA